MRLDTDLGILKKNFSTLQDARQGLFLQMSEEYRYRILMKKLSQVYLWTRQYPLNFEGLKVYHCGDLNALTNVMKSD